MKATIITIGDEILIGQIVDTNSVSIAKHLNAAGIVVHEKVSIGDDSTQIVRSVERALGDSNVVVITGGLGPTKDDITKKTLAGMFGCELVPDQRVADHVKRMLEGRGIEFNELNRGQAMVPACCTVLFNAHGTAPGMWFERDGKVVVSLPGVPYEMEHLMQDEVMPTNWDKKNQEEQGYVADYIRRIAKKFGNKMTEKGPYTARAGQLVHLKTDFYFLLKNTDHIGDLLQELHPTPAVCGLPKEEAFRFILNNEGYDRSYYSGFTGWLDTEGHTDIYVNLRCMEIKPGEAILYAGGGILASSEVESEWVETGDKMNTMRSILHPDFISKQMETIKVEE